MRDDADLGLEQRRVGLDAVDERGAARRGGEQALEHDETGPLLDDGLQRLDRFGIRERQDLAVLGAYVEAVAERRRQIVGSNNQSGRGHRVSLA